VGPRGVLDDGGEEKNSQLLPGIEPYNPDRPPYGLVVIPTELSESGDKMSEQ
jgi:hypothetical protein